MRESAYWSGGTIPWISSADVKVRLIADAPYKITEHAVQNSSTTLLPANSIILVVRSGILRKFLPVARNITEVAINQDIKAIIPDGMRAPEYIQHLLSWAGPRILATCLKSGTTVESIEFKWLKSFAVAIPPTLAEQSAIATALSDADSLIESLEDLIAKKRQIKQGAMQELLTGKRRLPGFSGAWEVKSLGDLFVFSAGVGASRDQLGHNGYCYLHYGDIHTSHKLYVNVRTEFNDIPKLSIPLGQIAPSSLLADGDVVFVDASEDDEGTSKHIVVINPDHIPFISGLHTIVAKAKNSMLGHRYRQYCFQTRGVKEQFRFYAVGTKVSGISKSNITKIVLPVPSLPEQTAIATILSDMDTELDALTAKLAKARQIKQGMMQELLTGRIRLI